MSVKRIALEVTLDTWMGLEPTNPGGVEPRSGRFQSPLPRNSETHYNFGWETQRGFCPASRAFPGELAWEAWGGKQGTSSYLGECGREGKTLPNFGSRVKPRAWGLAACSGLVPGSGGFCPWWRQVLCARTVVARQPSSVVKGLGFGAKLTWIPLPLQASVSSSVKWE